MKRSSSNDPKTVLLVVVIVAIGVISSFSQNPLTSWAAGIFSTADYQRDGDYYTWTQNLSENPQGFDNLGFDTINGKVSVDPQKEDASNVDVVATIRIKKNFLTGESSVMSAKEKTGVEILKENKEIRFKVTQPKSSFFGLSNNINVDLAVKVPKGYRIRANTVNGQVVLRKIDSPIELHSVNGTVKAEECAGPVSANTVNGNIELRGILKSFRLETVNGSVHTNLNGTPEEDCKATTVNGNVNISLASPVGFDVEMNTVNGKAEINEKNKFEGEMKKKSARGKINGGGKHLTMNAVNGSLRIE